MRAWPALSLSVYDPSSTPMRRIWLLCCPRAVSGHAATLPTEMINSRRLITGPSFRSGIVAAKTDNLNGGMSALGQKQTCAAHKLECALNGGQFQAAVLTDCWAC